MNIAVKLSGDTVVIYFGCPDEDKARELAKNLVEQLQNGGIDMQLIDPTHFYPPEPNEVN